MTVAVVTPSQNRARFKSDGVVGTTRDGANATIGVSRNVALTVAGVTPRQNRIRLPPRNIATIKAAIQITIQ